MLSLVQRLEGLMLIHTYQREPAPGLRVGPRRRFSAVLRKLGFPSVFALRSSPSLAKGETQPSAWLPASRSRSDSNAPASGVEGLPASESNDLIHFSSSLVTLLLRPNPPRVLRLAVQTGTWGGGWRHLHLQSPLNHHLSHELLLYLAFHSRILH